MTEKRVSVWVQQFPDRKNLMLQWHDPDTGQRKSKSAGTADEKEAERKRGDLEADLNHGRHAETSRMAWERFRELFEAEYLPGVRKDTRKVYGHVLDLFEEVCRPTSLRGITARKLSAFVAALRQRKIRGGKIGMHPYTIHVRLRFLHAVLAWAVEQELMPKCPAFPKINVPKRKPQPVPAEAFERLLAETATDPQMRALVLCGWLAGLRLEASVSLEREPTEDAAYLDLARSRIILPAGFVKADEDQWVPLDPQLREAIEALPRHGRKVFRFLNRRTGRPMVTDAIGNKVARLAKKAGVKLTMRSLRRGFGCRYAGKVSTHVLQRLMRHSSISITMGYYANIDSAVEEAILGTQRNTSRNTPQPDASPAELPD